MGITPGTTGISPGESPGESGQSVSSIGGREDGGWESVDDSQLGFSDSRFGGEEISVGNLGLSYGDIGSLGIGGGTLTYEHLTQAGYTPTEALGVQLQEVVDEYMAVPRNIERALINKYNVPVTSQMLNEINPPGAHTIASGVPWSDEDWSTAGQPHEGPGGMMPGTEAYQEEQLQQEIDRYHEARRAGVEFLEQNGHRIRPQDFKSALLGALNIDPTAPLGDVISALGRALNNPVAAQVLGDRVQNYIEGLSPQQVAPGPAGGLPSDIGAGIANAISEALGQERDFSSTDGGVTELFGRHIPDSVITSLARTINVGGALGPRTAAVIRDMTEEQRLAAGIYMLPNRTVLSPAEALERALTAIRTGAPLGNNARAALGALFNSIPDPGDRRDLVTRFALMTGASRDDVSSTVAEAAQTFREGRRTARDQAEATRRVEEQRNLNRTRNRVLRELGRDRTFTTENGNRVDIETVVTRAIKNLRDGRPLSANQRQVLREYRRETGSELGRRETAFRTEGGDVRTRAQVLASAQNRLESGRRLTANQVLALRQEGIRVTAASRAPARTIREIKREALSNVDLDRTFTTNDGRTVSSAYVLTNALRSLRAGRPLTHNQRVVLRDAGISAPTQTFTTPSGRIKPRAQILREANERLAAGRTLTPKSADSSGGGGQPPEDHAGRTGGANLHDSARRSSNLGAGPRPRARAAGRWAVPHCEIRDSR